MTLPDEDRRIVDVLIVGAGPAGLTAAIYARRAALDTLILERGVPGGLLVEAHTVENFPGHPEPLPGWELMDRVRRQAEQFGAHIVTADARALRPENGLWQVCADDATFTARTVILALGARPRTLGARGLHELTGKGVSYCASCDGYFHQGKPVLVVGAGDAALTEALFLSRIASHVYVAVRHPPDAPRAVRAAALLRTRVEAHPNIEFLWNQTVDETCGEGTLEGVVLRDLSTGQRRRLDVSGLFVKVGYVPATDWVRDVVDTTQEGYIRTDPWMRTRQRGVFAAGDVREPLGRCSQAVVAAAEGTIAALEAEKVLSELGGG